MWRQRPSGIVSAVTEKGQPPVVVASASWRARVLLAAQIGESLERAVISASDVSGALKLVVLLGVDPLAMLIHIVRRVSPDDLARLLEAQTGTPLVLVVGRLQHPAFDEVSPHCAAYLLRPVRIGEIADAVDRFLGEKSE